MWIILWIEMMKHFLIIGTILSVISLSCSKSNNEPAPTVVFDTIFPGEYFPAFPGSWWLFDNGDTMKVAGRYEVFVFNAAGYTAEPDYDTLVLPKLIPNGIFNPPDEFAFVNGHSISKGSFAIYRDPAFKGLLSTVEGLEFAIGGAVQGHKITGKTINTDTAVYVGQNLYQDVIITIQFDYACVSGTSNSPEGCAYLREFYARNIGLIRRDTLNGDEYVKAFELKEFFINHP